MAKLLYLHFKYLTFTLGLCYATKINTFSFGLVTASIDCSNSTNESVKAGRDVSKCRRRQTFQNVNAFLTVCVHNQKLDNQSFARQKH